VVVVMPGTSDDLTVPTFQKEATRNPA
jgi:hypothetical protein